MAKVKATATHRGFGSKLEIDGFVVPHCTGYSIHVPVDDCAEIFCSLLIAEPLDFEGDALVRLTATVLPECELIVEPLPDGRTRYTAAYRKVPA